MNYMQKCCFICGQKELPKEEMAKIKISLNYEIRRLIRKGVKYFFCGYETEFDELVCQTILDFKEKYTHIKLVLLFTHRQKEYLKSKYSTVTYEKIKSNCDYCYYTKKDYKQLADICQTIICYNTFYCGTTASVVNYAKKNGINLINIATICLLFG